MLKAFKGIFGGGGKEREGGHSSPGTYVVSLPADGEIFTGRIASSDLEGNVFTAKTAKAYAEEHNGRVIKVDPNSNNSQFERDWESMTEGTLRG